MEALEQEVTLSSTKPILISAQYSKSQ